MCGGGQTPQTEMSAATQFADIVRPWRSSWIGAFATLVFLGGAALTDGPNAAEVIRDFLGVLILFWLSQAGGIGDPALQRKIKNGAARTRQNKAKSQQKEPIQLALDFRGRNAISPRSSSRSARRDRKTPVAKQAARLRRKAETAASSTSSNHG